MLDQKKLVLGVDSREDVHSAEYKRALVMQGIPFTTDEAMPAGDLKVGKVLAERKTIGDFISSWTKHRVQRQGWELIEYSKEHGLIPVLIIHGDVEQEIKYRQKETKNKSMTVQTFWDMVMDMRKTYPEMSIVVLSQQSNPEIELQTNSKLARKYKADDMVRKLDECISAVVALARAELSQKTTYTVPTHVMELRDENLRMFAYLGIDQRKGRLLLEKFGSFLGAVNAPREEVLAISGLGSATADALARIGGK